MTSIRAKRKLPSLVFSKLYKNLFPALGECSLTILALPWIPGPAVRLGHQRLRSVTAVRSLANISKHLQSMHYLLKRLPHGRRALKQPRLSDFPVQSMQMSSKH
jgi:hypothetical protein